MSYINFDKKQLVNLEYSLNKEFVRSNRAGAYASSTIINCNTRKYHGLLIVPQPAIDGENHVLLSTLDETIIQRDAEFNLGIHKFPDVYFPKGHKYIRDLEAKTIPILTYNVGGVVLTKESLLASEDDRYLAKYTLVEAHSPTKLKFRPFLAFRNIHTLSKANVYVDTKYEKIDNGIKVRMYTGYSYLYIQFSRDVEYVHVPDWYYNIEYIEEKNRGYDFQEDLFIPGFFELPIKTGESIYISVGVEPCEPEQLPKIFNKEVKSRVQRTSYENCLQNAAQQFIVRKNKKTEVVAGYPWFGRWGRDTFIATPGLTLALNDPKTCKEIIDTMIADLKGPLFPNVGSGSNASYNSVDASLWFFWTLQQYSNYTGTADKIWKEYNKKMKLILEGYREGTEFNIKMQDNGLIYAGEQGYALTWMDAVVAGKPVTPRIGMPVEINALWYNAIMYALEVANFAGDKKFIKEWSTIAEKIEKSFIEVFWLPEKRYLADYVNGDYKDDAVRPNQVFATSMPYTPLGEQMRASILEIIMQDLLTPRGLRTLSPKNPNYKGTYCGDQATRDNAYHQGTVWPWLLGHFAEGYLNVYKKHGVTFIKTLYEEFSEVMKEHGIGTISEIYDGDPPHAPKGAISQAWSVAEILRIKMILDQFNKK